MTYLAAEARQQLLDAVGEAVDRLATALGALGAAYEQLDEGTADRLEEELFGPVQKAYGRAQRTYSGFAERHRLTTRGFAPPPATGAHGGARPLIDRAVDQASEADHELATLQDSMMPVEVGDAELRSGLAEVRELLAGIRGRARELERVLGR